MRFIGLITLFATTATWACPQLAGLHVGCRTSAGTVTKVRIVQAMKDEVTTYKVTWNGERTKVHVADGVTRETPVFDTGVVMRTSATCDGDLLRHTFEMSNINVTQEYWKESGKLRFRALDADGVYNEISCR